MSDTISFPERTLNPRRVFESAVRTVLLSAPLICGQLNPVVAQQEGRNTPKAGLEISNNSRPTEVISSLRTKSLTSVRGGEHEEYAAYDLCSFDMQCTVHSTKAGFNGFASLSEFFEFQNAFLNFRFKGLNDPTILFLLHNHPFEGFKRLFTPGGNVVGAPALEFPRPEKLLSGPSSQGDCRDHFDTAGQISQKTKPVSVIVDPGGFWLCVKTSKNRGYGPSEGGPIVGARVVLMTASQYGTEAEISAAVQTFEKNAPHVIGINTKFMPFSATNEEIFLESKRLLEIAAQN